MIVKSKEYTKDSNLIKQYSILYTDFLNKKISEIEIFNFKNQMFINNEIIHYMELFAQLDHEFKQYGEHPDLIETGSKIFSPDYIKNKSWRGYWLKATGIDCQLFTNWLISAIEYEKYHNTNLEQVYLEAHPEEKYVPHSIKTAYLMFIKYYK